MGDRVWLRQSRVTLSRSNRHVYPCLARTDTCNVSRSKQSRVTLSRLRRTRVTLRPGPIRALPRVGPVQVSSAGGGDRHSSRQRSWPASGQAHPGDDPLPRLENRLEDVDREPLPVSERSARCRKCSLSGRARPPGRTRCRRAARRCHGSAGGSPPGRGARANASATRSQPCSTATPRPALRKDTTR